MKITYYLIILIAIAAGILIFAPKKRNHTALHIEGDFCGATHADLTEQGLCERCGNLLG